MAEGATQPSKVRKKFIWLISVIVLIAILSLILLKTSYKSASNVYPTTTTVSGQQAALQPGSPIINQTTGQQRGVKCPAGYCGDVVTGTGTCPSGSGPYSKQTCYGYPDYASSMAECEQKKSTYLKICGFVK
jgi:hypothetical protein